MTRTADQITLARLTVERASDGTETLVVLAGAVVDSSGGSINPDSFAHTLAYNSDGTLATDSFTDGSATWTQTFTYTSGKLTGVSAWVKA
jgi:YD repeat-containing protein